MVDEAAGVRDRYGITSFKVKVAARPVHADVAVVRALRAGLGEDVELYLDGNRGWTAAEAAQALRLSTTSASRGSRSSTRPTTCSPAAGWCSAARCPTSPTRAPPPPPT